MDRHSRFRGNPGSHQSRMPDGHHRIENLNTEVDVKGGSSHLAIGQAMAYMGQQRWESLTFLMKPDMSPSCEVLLQRKTVG